MCRGAAQSMFNGAGLSDCNKLPIHAMFDTQRPSVWNDQFTYTGLSCTTPSLPPPSAPSPPAPPPSTAGDDPTFIGYDGQPYHVCTSPVMRFRVKRRPKCQPAHTSKPCATSAQKPPTSTCPLVSRLAHPFPHLSDQVLGEPWKYFNIISAPTISLNAQVLSSYGPSHSRV